MDDGNDELRCGSVVSFTLLFDSEFDSEFPVFVLIRLLPSPMPTSYASMKVCLAGLARH